LKIQCCHLRLPRYWEGKIGEIIIWGQPLTGAETAGIQAFLYKKWISLADLDSPLASTIWGDVTTSTSDIDPSRQLLIMLNPTTGQFRIQATGVDHWQLFVTDIQGRLLWQQKGSGSAIPADLNRFRNGIFLVQLA
jgi:hypothetical protein